MTDLKKKKLEKIIEEAENEDTLPERLQEIYDSYAPGEIKKILTENPNTPLEILFELGEYYPEELLQNSVVDLYLLSNPNFLAEIPKKTFLSILELIDIPTIYLLFALNNFREEEILTKIIFQHTQQWNQWRENNADEKINLMGVDFKDFDLRGILLDKNILLSPKWELAWDIINHPQFYRNLNWVDLSGSDLSGADLTSANLRWSDLSNSNLTDVNLIGANLTCANLTNADLTGANLTNANLTGVNLKGTELDDSTLIDHKSRLIWHIINCPRQGRILPDVDLSYANLKNTNLENANLSNANLSNADLSNANLSNASLYEADVSNAELAYTNFMGSDLTGTNFAGANLSGADLTYGDLIGAILQDIKIDKNTLMDEKWLKQFNVYYEPESTVDQDDSITDIYKSELIDSKTESHNPKLIKVITYHVHFIRPLNFDRFGFVGKGSITIEPKLIILSGHKTWSLPERALAFILLVIVLQPILPLWLIIIFAGIIAYYFCVSEKIRPLGRKSTSDFRRKDAQIEFQARDLKYGQFKRTIFQVDTLENAINLEKELRK